MGQCGDDYDSCYEQHWQKKGVQNACPDGQVDWLIGLYGARVKPDEGAEPYEQHDSEYD
jgi:hypothetical protein